MGPVEVGPGALVVTPAHRGFGWFLSGVGLFLQAVRLS